MLMSTWHMRKHVLYVSDVGACLVGLFGILRLSIMESFVFILQIVIKNANFYHHCNIRNNKNDQWLRIQTKHCYLSSLELVVLIYFLQRMVTQNLMMPFWNSQNPSCKLNASCECACKTEKRLRLESTHYTRIYLFFLINKLWFFISNNIFQW